MANIYQEIWDADLLGSGVKPIFHDQEGSATDGYVKVNRLAYDAATKAPETKVLTEVNIPQSRARTYDLVTRLFNNYALDEQLIEVETPEEREEVHNLLQEVVATPPMQVAQSYLQSATGTTVSKERMYTTLLEMWFRPFGDGNRPALSGFEHVFVGEQKGSTAGGYHFWYKYWLDDNLASVIEGGRARLPGFSDDRIVYIRSKSADEQEDFPESVTISYRWDAPDYERNAVRPLTKPTGGFFVGCSVEGLLAMGTVRAHLGARAPKEAVINGARYEMALYRSANNQHVRTFYPKFLGRAGLEQPDAAAPGTPSAPSEPIPPPVTGPVRIVGALLNPAGADPGSEAVTLLNTGPTRINLSGWRLVDRMQKHYEIGGLDLPGGGAATVILPKNTMQLSNKGGEIRLVSRSGHTVHLVTYSKAQAQREGETVVF